MKKWGVTLVSIFLAGCQMNHVQSKNRLTLSLADAERGCSYKMETGEITSTSTGVECVLSHIRAVIGAQPGPYDAIIIHALEEKLKVARDFEAEKIDQKTVEEYFEKISVDTERRMNNQFAALQQQAADSAARQRQFQNFYLEMEKIKAERMRNSGLGMHCNAMDLGGGMTSINCN